MRHQDDDARIQQNNQNHSFPERVSEKLNKVHPVLDQIRFKWFQEIKHQKNIAK